MELELELGQLGSAETSDSDVEAESGKRKESSDLNSGGGEESPSDLKSLIGRDRTREEDRRLGS